jgi:arabinogalactan oligomer/maltooligosaccharide transport system permease protein
MILITSNMTAIPSQLYEAATIDGANKYQQFTAITLPLVLFQTMPILIMQFAGNINNFGATFFLTQGGPSVSDTIATQAGATDLLISWIYKLTNLNFYNMASVLSVLVFIFLVPFAVFQFTRTKSFKEGEI